MIKLVKYLSIITLCCIVLGIGALFGLYKYIDPQLPEVSAIKDIQLQLPMQIYSSEGKLIGQFGEQHRIPLAHGELPDLLIKAFIATEDSRFSQHHGIDPVGIFRAGIRYISSNGRRKEGASTITQQLARNYFLSSERTLLRKIKEVFLALKIEREFTKEEILQLYMNKIELGHRAYGVGAAAAVYFGKTPNELTLSEIATIAGLPKAPSKYNPISHPNDAKARRNTVLWRMLKEGYITNKQYKATLNDPIVSHYHGPDIEFKAHYVSEMVRLEMLNLFQDRAYQDGYKIYTTIQENLQTAANDALITNLLQYEERQGYRGSKTLLWEPKQLPWTDQQIVRNLKKYRNYGPLSPAIVKKVNSDYAQALLKDGQSIILTPNQVKWAAEQKNTQSVIESVLQAGQLIWVREVNDSWRLAQLPQANSALISLDANDGAILALVGGFDYNLSKFNRVTQSVRQAGSNIKPFMYAAALDKGMTLATILNDLPITRWNADNGQNWRPKNSPNTYSGPLRLRVGLGLSKNVMMVRAMRAMGVNYAADYLERFGFVTPKAERGESLALGATTVTPLQMARGYAVFANSGYLIQPYFIRRIEDHEGRVIFEAKPRHACSELCNQPVMYGDIPKSIKLIDQIIEADEPATHNNDIVDMDNDDIIITDDDDNLESSISNRSVIPAEIDSPIITGQFDTTKMTSRFEYAPHVISNEIAFLLKDGLKSNIFGEAGGNWLPTGWRARALKRNDVGGKTGTTNNNKDAWFTGYGANIVTSVWVGFDDHRRSLGRNEGGAITAQPAWDQYMKVALQDVPIKAMILPKGIKTVEIDMATGKLAVKNSPSRKEYFITGTEPKVSAVQDVGLVVIDTQTGNEQELF